MARYTFGDTRPGAAARIVAVEDGVIAGFATTGPARDAPGAGELLALYVERERRGTDAFTFVGSACHDFSTQRLVQRK